MDVATNDAVKTALRSVLGRDFFKALNETYRTANSLFDECGERPVTLNANQTPQPGQNALDPHQQFVAVIAQHS